MEDNIVLTTNELQILSELDSRQFGFIKLSEDLHLSKKTAALKAIQEKDWCWLKNIPVYTVYIYF